MKPEMKEFAQILVQQVRDAAIQSCDRQLQSDTTSPVAKRWKAIAANGNPTDLAKVMIPDCVDEVLSCLLQAIDQEVLRLSFTGSNGKSVDLVAEGLGEVSGWYMGSGGWRTMYARERFVDDFSDLAK